MAELLVRPSSEYPNWIEAAGPLLEHRATGRPVQLVFECDLSRLDACLQRLPQDRRNFGFRLTVNGWPLMLKPNGNWARARVTRASKQRVGWQPTRWFIHPQGLCNSVTFEDWRTDHYPLPVGLHYAQHLANFSESLSDDPRLLQSAGLDASTHCMCCGRRLSVETSQQRSIGPECLVYLEDFLGTTKTIEEIEQEVTD